MSRGITEATRRLLAWPREGLDEPVDSVECSRDKNLQDVRSDAVEGPWRYRWDHLPKRSAGFNFSNRDYDMARVLDEELARLTFGDDVWTRVRRAGYVDLPSSRYPGVTYRLRVGRRIEVRCAPTVQPPWCSRSSLSAQRTRCRRLGSSPTSVCTRMTTRMS